MLALAERSYHRDLIPGIAERGVTVHGGCTATLKWGRALVLLSFRALIARAVQVCDSGEMKSVLLPRKWEEDFCVHVKTPALQ